MFRSFLAPQQPVRHGVKLNVHLASLREPRLEELPVGGGTNKLKVRIRIRSLGALPVVAEAVEKLPNHPF